MKSDAVALVVTVTFLILFIASSSYVAVHLAEDRVPKAARQIGRLVSDRPGLRQARWQKRVDMTVASVFLVVSQAVPVGAIAQNLGHSPPSVLLILAAEPVLATVWAAYLLRHARAARGPDGP